VQAGERIVVAGVHKLTAGERVSVVEQPEPVAAPASTSKAERPRLPSDDAPNLSEWALRHRSLIAYLIVVLMLSGVFAYFKLGRAEDPDFTFKVMVVRTLWPGATAHEVELQVTERIEKKLAGSAVGRRHALADSKPGESLVFITLKDYTPKKEVPERLVPGAQEDRRHAAHAARKASSARSSTTSSATPSSPSTR
jgi:hypothetical protein